MNIEINLKVISKWLLGQLKGTIQGFWNMLKAVIMTAIVGYIAVTIASVSGCTNAQGFLKSLAGEEPIEVTGSVDLDKNYTITDAGVIHEESELTMCLGILDNLTAVDEGSINLETVESSEDLDNDLSGYIDELKDAHTYCSKQRDDLGERYAEDMNSKDAEITRLKDIINVLLGGDQEKIDMLFSDSSGEDDE